jgi:ribosomal protein S18 acetylase RimI-like enzyme
MPSSRVRLVRLDACSDDERKGNPGVPNDGSLSSSTKELLERLVEIDEACFPNDAGGVASARTLASSPRLRRVTRLVLVYESFEGDDSSERSLKLVEGKETETNERTSSSDTFEGIDTLVAFASYTASSMCFEVTKVACAPSSRRRGYAKNAVAAILDEARKKKIARVALRVEKTNVAAVSLYESLGFREDVSRATAHEGYYGAGRHGAVYEYFP